MKFIITLWITSAVYAFLLAGTAYGDQNPTEKILSALDNMEITLSGSIEVEAAYTDTDGQDTSDITLATVELGIDARPLQYISGHLTLLYEEDDTDLEIDEGYIRLDGEEKCPFYAEAGQFYLPFGRYASHFISDPLTLELGETRESALVLGYSHRLFTLSFGIFNGEVNEADERDDMIDGYCADAVYTMPGMKGLSFSAGLSYLSNIGDSDGLTDQLDPADNQMADDVPAVAAFISADWNETIFCKLEHVRAMDHFSSTDFTFAAGDIEPWALNLELAWAVSDGLEVGLRYGASDDAGTFLPESLYGAVIRYAPGEHVETALELQAGEYEDGSDITTAALQLALSF